MLEAFTAALVATLREQSLPPCLFWCEPDQGEIYVEWTVQIRVTPEHVIIYGGGRTWCYCYEDPGLFRQLLERVRSLLSETVRNRGTRV